MKPVMLHDLGSPAFGTRLPELYPAVLDTCAWADEVAISAR
jgi:hypothetical protein